MIERRQNARDLACVREACSKARARAWSLPEGSLERAAACTELRRLEQVAASLRASAPIVEVPCGACGGFGIKDDDRFCALCRGSGILEAIAA